MGSACKTITLILVALAYQCYQCDSANAMLCFGPIRYWSASHVVQLRRSAQNRQFFLIPYTPGSMVGYRVNAFFLSFLCQVIEEEVDENGIDLRVGLELKHLFTQKFDSPYAASCKAVVSSCNEVTHSDTDLPLICISHVCPLSIVSRRRILASKDGQNHTTPRA